MPKYKVRDGFWVHGLDDNPIDPGQEIELDDEQAERWAAQIEPVAAPPAKAGKK